MRETKFIIKFIILPVFLTIVFNLLEYGLIWDKYYNFLYPMILTAVFITNMQVPRLRRFWLALAYGVLFLMVLLYLTDHINLSNNIGSAGFAILIITVLTYLPELINKGHLDKF